MDKNNSNINNYNHSVSLLERKTLVITGVKKIDTFDKLHFILDTTMGFMIIKGDSLELVKLDTLSGNVTIKGTINSIEYVLENKKSNDDGIISRLFKYWHLKCNYYVYYFLFYMVFFYIVYLLFVID